MSVSIGNKSIGQIFIGNKEVQSIYIGNTSIYENYKFEWSFSESGATLVKYTDGTRTNVKIPSKIGHDGVLYDVVAIGNNAFANTNITSITIPDSVTSIGRYAFSNCSSLTSITIPDSVTSIGYDAFRNCSSLTSVVIGNSVTSIDRYAFESCSSLTSVLYTGDIASWCGISFGSSDANPLSYAHNLYINNTLVTEITIPDTVTEIKARAFYGWNGTSITITDGVRSIGSSAFSGCSSLTSVTISDGVTSIGINAFRDCSSLTSITIPDSVTSIGGWAFYNCSSLAHATIGIGVLSIGEYAFYNCSSLATITYNGTLSQWNNITKGTGWDTGTGDYGDYVVICIGDSITKALDKQGVIYTLSNNEYEVTGYSVSPTSISIKATIGGNSVTSIGNYAFENCQSLTSVTIPDSVMSIGSNAFYGCPIETASIPAIACSSIKNSSLETVIITSGTSIGDYVFANCTNLTSVTIHDSVTSIGEQAFWNCQRLTTTTIGNGVTSIGSSAFDSCFNLTSVYYNGNIASWCGIEFDDSYANPLRYAHNLYINNTLVTEITIPDTVAEIQRYAFVGWNGTSITITDGVTSIGSGAFANCIHLVSITIPDSVTDIGNAAFYGCTSLATITYNGTLSQWNDIIKGTNWDNSEGNYVVVCTDGAIDKQGVTYELSNNQYTVTSYNGSVSYVDIRPLIATYSVTSIAANVFENKTSLTKIGIPSNISTIGASALSGCSGLQEIIYSGTLSQWNSITKGTGWDTGTGDYVLVCSGSGIAFDKQGITYTLTQGAYHASSYSGSEEDMIIRGAINDINVTTINPELFIGDTTITSVTIPGNVQTIGKNSFQGCTKLATVNLNEGTQVIGAGAFAGCDVLSKISISGTQLNTLPSTISSVGSYAFSQCGVLTNLAIPSGVRIIPEGMMWGCANFSYISLPNTINSIGALAFNATPLETIQYAGTVDSWATITKGNDWDYQTNNYTIKCTDGYIRNNGVVYKPTTGDLLYVYGYIGTSTSQPVSVAVESSVNSISVISIGESAFDNKNISEITLPSTITSVGANAFRNCPIIFANIPTIAISSIPKSALQTVVIDGGSSIGSGAFANCTSLTDVAIRDSVASIDSSAFGNCSNLTGLTIGSGVTSMGDGAFRGCSSLTSVTIPDSVTSIGKTAFDSCIRLTSVTVLPASPPTLSGIGAFQNTNNCPIYVPAASVSAYQAASYWSTYASRIQAISS